MKRYQRFLAGAVVLALAWLAAMHCCSKDIGLFASSQAKQIVPVLPLYLIVTYGAYSLASIGWSLIVFNDVPHEAALLEKVQAASAVLFGCISFLRHACSVFQEIEQAKSDLARRGFKF